MRLTKTKGVVPRCNPSYTKCLVSKGNPCVQNDTQVKKFRSKAFLPLALILISALPGQVAQAATAQTITFTQPAAMTVGQADQTLTASASSALAVSLATNNTAICTIVIGKLHAVAAGSCIVTATQAGNATFAGASEAIGEYLIKNRGVNPLWIGWYRDYSKVIVAMDIMIG